MRSKRFLASAFITLVLCGIGEANSFAQTSSGETSTGQSDSQTIKALLDEVRQLRLVLQRNSLATYRAQVTLERLKFQQARVDQLFKEQADLQNRIKEVERNLPTLSNQAGELEKLLAVAATPTERNEREMMIRAIKGELENEKQRLQDWREREPQIAARLQTEQAKLAELNDNLDKLERELESAAADKGKRP